ncbi:LysR family transcriptional regulator [Pseudacidobacterium ailaaui]|jgi:DNA-binding transcriptional LysR family regulator|uniref:LysR family transcriptional regulator n=1 Tax=Pseudacidobacterium ailaaui TaxID=1382359 RepID=UPI0006791AAC|nr:LysR family transcriptional regulator [Pseudacidobacterium ailaaui]
MNDWVEFRHFKYLLAIVEHKGFRAAAESLHTAQPNLSAQARHFQEIAGVHLFRRSSDGRIQITDTGVAFEAIARNVLQARDEALAALVAIERGEIHSLRLGCGLCVSPELFHLACEAHKKLIPGCQIWPVHNDSVRLVQEVISGDIDAALVTLPVSDDRLQIEEIWRNRLMVCLRANHPLAALPALQPEHLQENLSVLIDPQRHPDAHAVLLKFLEAAGVHLREYSRVSHPHELQELVKEGYGFALVCEGTVHDAELTTRPVAGMDWALRTAFAYNKQSHPKTIPVLLRCLKKQLGVFRA